jgi:cytochrome c peroxidase
MQDAGRGARGTYMAALVASLVLAACGGSGSEAADASAGTEMAIAAASSDALVTSDAAQPSAADPGVFLSDGSLAQQRAQALHAGTDDDAPPPVNEAAVEVGEFLFKDVNLSAGGRQACATCHDETSGHADAPGTRLPLGGPDLNLPGMRSSMTVRYLNLAPPFRLSHHGTPSGGFLWDGRADDRFEQVFHDGPFFNAVEQALPGDARNPQALTDRVRAAEYWPQLEALYADRPDKIDSDRKLFRQIAKLIEIYQRDDEDYNLFDSKFDAVVAGQATFTAEEQRGWQIFNDRRRGNCVACHSASLNDPQSLFTNFGYSALGVPRNHEGPLNADAAFFDLGLCARQKASTNTTADHAVRKARYCGLFKTPTLRNVERTAPYFHNASVDTLEQAVRFHFERDTQPAKWYRKADGSLDSAYNDLPQRYRGNLATGRPFNGRWQPSDVDMADLLAFLRTLNDADQTEPLPAR